MRIGFVYFHTSTFDLPDKLFEQLLPSFYSGAWLTVSMCLVCALAQEAREIKIREHVANSAHLDDSFEPPKVQEMNGLQLLESSAHTLIYGEPKGHQEKSFFL